MFHLKCECNGRFEVPAELWKRMDKTTSYSVLNINGDYGSRTLVIQRDSLLAENNSPLVSMEGGFQEAAQAPDIKCNVCI